MIINLSPQRRDDALAILKSDDTLNINGLDFDFSGIEEGDLLPREAVGCEFLISDVERVNGDIVLTLILPNGANASQSARFPQPIINPPDGVVELPS